MFRIATSDGLFTGLRPACRFRAQLVNLFELIGICAHPRSADAPPLRSHSLLTRSLARVGLWRSEFSVPPVVAVRLLGTSSAAQKSQVRPGRLENLFAADLSKEQSKRAAERVVLHGEEADAVTEQRCDRIPPFELTFTRVTKHHFAFLAFHAKVLRTTV